MRNKDGRTFYIYCHTSPSGKRYIGQTCNDPEKRWSGGRGYIDCPYFHRAIEKYGWDNIRHEILMLCHTKEMANLLEIRLIARFETTNRDKGYNVSKGGDGPLGVTWTEEHRKRQSKLMTGNGNSMYGRHHTAESRALISKNRKGKPVSDEMRELRTSVLRKANARRKTPIVQCDLDGNPIATYPGLSDAVRENGYSHATIWRVLNGKGQTAYGFKWEYVDEELKERARAYRESERKRKPPAGHGVIQYDLDGNEVARYSSLCDVERKTGLCRDRVGDCCHGGLESYGGYVWRHDEQATKEADNTAVAQLDIDGNLIAKYGSLAEASRNSGIPRYLIRNCCRGVQETSHGFKWEFLNDKQEATKGGQHAIQAR